MQAAGQEGEDRGRFAVGHDGAARGRGTCPDPATLPFLRLIIRHRNSKAKCARIVIFSPWPLFGRGVYGTNTKGVCVFSQEERARQNDARAIEEERRQRELQNQNQQSCELETFSSPHTYSGFDVLL